MKNMFIKIIAFLFALTSFAPAFAFDVDTSPNPPDYAAIAPDEGEVVAVNPPSMVWRVDERAASYIVELSPDKNFAADVIRVPDVKFPFYNHSGVLPAGRWYWRYFVVDDKGEVSTPGPVRSFVVDKNAVPLPVPPMKTMLEKMPAHPRIFVTPATLPAFRARRNGPAKDAWEVVRAQADALLEQKPKLTNKRVPLEEARVQLKKIKTPGISHYKENTAARRQVFWLDDKNEAFWTPDYSYGNLNADAAKTQILAYAYLISGDAKYAEAARAWLDFLSAFRLDYHYGDAKKRADHDSASYAYEQGLKDVALAFDHVYDHLSPAERSKVLAHIEFHAEAAVNWLKAAKIEVRYQQSHPQQTMHNTLTTLLAVATDSPKLSELASWVVPQYMNRIAWTSPDGGYFEGQTYGHKFRWILEGLVAIRTATGVDLFQKPEIKNSGAYWLYAMDLNYWYQHYGDIYSLLWPYANGADGYISALMAEMTQDPYVKWYSQTVKTNPDHIPFRYLSEGPLQARPPIDIPQARAFVETGVLSAYDKFWDHGSNRLFFRSSPWGAHSHSHADQNGFVIHANNEILAPDTGYYTYSGDTYQNKWSKATFAHNSVLVNGKGQPTDINSKGHITQFFNAGDFTYFVGDASQAYEAPLQTFRRAMLFVRPNVYVVYDELAAGEPSVYSWLLNTFAKPEIDEKNQRLVVAQQNERLQVEQLLPRGMTYTTTNERPYPIKTKAWSRITEAFPQAWHTRANTPPSANSAILTLMQTYEASADAKISTEQSFETPSTVGLKIKDGNGREGTILFRRQLDKNGIIESGGLRSDAQSATLFARGNAIDEWMLNSGRQISWQGKTLLQTENSISAALAGSTPAAAAALHFDGAPGQIELSLSAAPRQVFLSSSAALSDAKSVAFKYQKGMLTLTSAATSGVLWIDPKVDLSAPIPATDLSVQDSTGTYKVPLRAAWSPSGEWVYYAQTDAREPGEYSFARSDNGASEFLIQDIWQPSKSVRGNDATTGEFREGTELYFTVAPTQNAPQFSAQLKISQRGQIVNLLNNGDFEEGIAEYLPRQWTMQRTSSSSEDVGWGEWSQEDKHGGKSSLRFLRVGDQRTLTAQPMRLRTGGEYHLRFFAKGDADNAFVKINGAGARTISVPVEPSAEWKEYRAKIDLLPGYTTLQVVMMPGKNNAVLWLDDVEFGRIVP
jgi:hypothetical protein